MIRAAMKNTRKWPPPKYAYVGPFYNQAKRIAWGYVRHYCDPIPQRNPVESDPKVMILPNGAEIRVLGADNPDSLRGDYLDGLVADEFADWAPSVYPLVLRPMLSDYRGWGVFIGTPKGHNAFYDQHEEAKAEPENWFSKVLKASESGIIPEEELADARKSMTPDQYAQEYECSFEAALVGAYWGKELADAERRGRMVDDLYDSLLPVHTAWDLGVSDSTAIWFFQVSAGEIRVVDSYENHGFGLDHYVDVLNAKRYRYGDHWVPHDAKVRELGTGKTRIETLIGLGLQPKIVPDHTLQDGINAARLTISAAWFDRINCKLAIEAIKQYQREFDEKVRQFKEKPRHDWTSHYADAWRYLAMAWRQMAPEPIKKPPPLRGVKDMTFDELLANQPMGSDRVR